MRRFFQLVFVLACLVCVSDGAIQNGSRLGRGGTINRFSQATSSVTYFLSERFEGSGYENTWSEVGTGTINEDYTTSPLEAAQSLQISAGAQNPRTGWTLTTDKSELWLFFQLRIDSALGSARTIVNLLNSSSVLVGGITLGTGNALQANAGGNSTATVSTLTTGTNYNVWFHWIKGSGANASASVAFSTTTTEPTSGNQFASMSSGTAVTDAHSLSLGFQSNSSGTLIFDKVLMSVTGTVGSNP